VETVETLEHTLGVVVLQLVRIRVKELAQLLVGIAMVELEEVGDQEAVMHIILQCAAGQVGKVAIKTVFSEARALVEVGQRAAVVAVVVVVMVIIRDLVVQAVVVEVDS
jgi:hypothetical protein